MNGNDVNMVSWARQYPRTLLFLIAVGASDVVVHLIQGLR
jgi:hypothetical protein